MEIVSDANRQAEIVRGQADARRNSVYANAYGADSEFFEFYRSLSAYERALKGENSTMVISPNGEFFNYLRSSNPEIAAEVAATGSADVPQRGAGEGQGDQGAAAVAERAPPPGLPAAAYLRAHKPAVDVLVECVGAHATQEVFTNVLQRYNNHCLTESVQFGKQLNVARGAVDEEAFVRDAVARFRGDDDD